MKTTASNMVTETGFCSVGYSQGGRQNAKHHVVTVGAHVVYPRAQPYTKAGAEKLARRIDGLVARWRACAR